jgi:putative MATE family efflux protein
MGVMPIHRLLLSMSIPMIISMATQALYNIVDSVFVAQLGENALTAVSLAFPVQSLIIGVGVGTGVGVNAFLSKSLGERNFKEVNNAALNGILLSWLSSAIFVAVGFLFVDSFFRAQTDISQIVGYGKDYLFVVCAGSIAAFSQIMFERLLISTGKTFYSMISQMVGAVTNIILDPIMIFGFFGCPRMEVAGAAVATVIGQFAGAFVAFYFNIKVNKEISFNVKGFRPNLGTIRRIYSVGLPSILMASVGSGMVYGLNRILIFFTETAAAVFGVYFKLQSFVFMPIFGLNNGMVPIIAYNYGARKRGRITGTIKFSLMYAVGIMLIGTAVFNIFPEGLLKIFNASPDMLSLGVPALRIISLHFLFAPFCVVSLSVFQALGNGIASLTVVVSRQLILLLPIAWLMSLSGNVNAIWWAFPITEMGALVLCGIFMTRVYAKKIKVFSDV